MGFLRAGQQTQAAQSPDVAGVRLQTSAYGACLPIVYGQNRVAGNIIWYGDFAVINNGGSSSSGKGGALSGGSGGKGPSGQTTYTAAVAIGIAEGPISGVVSMWASKTQTTASALGFGVFNGDYAAVPWGYLTTYHPDQALGYRGVAYAAAASYQLGNDAQLAAIPDPMWQLFGVGYLGYTGGRTVEKIRKVTR